MIFEQLSSKPIHTYNEQVNASFNDEWQYKGLSHYKDNYEQRTTKVNKNKHSLPLCKSPLVGLSKCYVDLINLI